MRGLGLERHLPKLEAEDIDMGTLESLASDEDRLRSVLIEAGLSVGVSVKISQAMTEASAARAKSKKIDEANRSMEAAAVRLQEKEKESEAFKAEVAKLRAAAAAEVPPDFECAISMEIMEDPVFAADGHTCE